MDFLNHKEEGMVFYQVSPFSFTVYNNLTVEIQKRWREFEEIHKMLREFSEIHMRLREFEEKYKSQDNAAEVTVNRKEENS